MTGKKHVGTFRMLLRDIGEEGYDLRCKIQNLSEFGLCQQRPRLLIIAARRGTPLPPFPKATHGPAGTKPWHYIKDALIPIERLGSRATGDRYHQPKPARKPRSPYDPRSFIGCITRSGANKYHYSGKRKYTPRELSQFQGFPLNYKFFGSRTTATEQIGNAFPPPMGEALYRNIAKTLEAFDGGYIEAEDDLTDLDGILERKGANLQHMRPAARTSFDPPSRPADLLSRYLVRDGPAGQATPSGASPFARRKDPVPRRRDRAINLMAEFLGHNEDDNDHENIEVRPRRRRRTAVYIDNETEPTWISESE
jgi:DNA (cytosine-5)-methyltransferase 1